MCAAPPPGLCCAVQQGHQVPHSPLILTLPTCLLFMNSSLGTLLFLMPPLSPRVARRTAGGHTVGALQGLFCTFVDECAVSVQGCERTDSSLTLWILSRSHRLQAKQVISLGLTVISIVAIVAGWGCGSVVKRICSQLQGIHYLLASKGTFTHVAHMCALNTDILKIPLLCSESRKYIVARV